MEMIKKSDAASGGEAENRIKTDYVKAAEKISEAAKEARTSANKAVQGIQEYCRENPGKAMAIAAGAGALVTFILMKALSEKRSPSDQIIASLLHKGEDAWNHLKSKI